MTQITLPLPQPFKGVIRDWQCVGEVVWGICAWHVDAKPLSEVLRPLRGDPLVIGMPMHTSRVVRITECGSFALLETRNSVYILMEPHK